jgi:hypothetical protein
MELVLGKYNIIDLERNLSVNQHTIPFDFENPQEEHKLQNRTKKNHAKNVRNKQPNQKSENLKNDESMQQKISTTINQYKALQHDLVNNKKDK